MDDDNHASSSSGEDPINLSRKRKFKKKKRANVESDTDSCVTQPISGNSRIWDSDSEAKAGASNSDLVSTSRKSLFRRRITNNTVNSDTSDSDIAMPKYKRSLKLICDSDTDFDDFIQTGTLKDDEKKRSGHCSNDNCFNSNQDSSEKCSICLSGFEGRDIATPETCQHVFCSPCLQEWAKKVNTCPIDRARFDHILVKDRRDFTVIKKIFVGCSLPSCSFCMFCGTGETEENTLDVCSDCGASYHQLCGTAHTRCRSCLSLWSNGNNERIRVPVASLAHAVLQSRQRSINVESSTTQDSDTSDDDNRFFNIRRQIQRVSAMCRCLQTSFEMLETTRGPVPPTAVPEPAACTRIYLPYNELGEEADSYFENHNYLADISYDDDGSSVIQSIPRTPVARRTKESSRRRFALSRNRRSISSILSAPSALPSLNPDIVGDLMQMQTQLHFPNAFVQKEDSHVLNSMEVSQQCPLNPVQEAPPKCNNRGLQDPSEFGNISTSSNISQSHSFSMTAGSSGGVDNRNYEANKNNDSYSLTSQRCGVLGIDAKHENTEGSQSKDAKKSHSDEEFDIYSDIESGNDEEVSLDPMDTDISALNLCTYKPEEPSHATHIADGTDSSDNDLVIDEDMHADEDVKPAKSTEENEYDQSSNGSDNSNQNNLLEVDGVRSVDNNVQDSIQSPDPEENCNKFNPTNVNNEPYMLHQPLRTKGAVKYIENDYDNAGGCLNNNRKTFNLENSKSSLSSSESSNSEDEQQTTVALEAENGKSAEIPELSFRDVLPHSNNSGMHMYLSTHVSDTNKKDSVIEFDQQDIEENCNSSSDSEIQPKLKSRDDDDEDLSTQNSTDTLSKINISQFDCLSSKEKVSVGCDDGEINEHVKSPKIKEAEILQNSFNANDGMMNDEGRIVIKENSVLDETSENEAFFQKCEDASSENESALLAVPSESNDENEITSKMSSPCKDVKEDFDPASTEKSESQNSDLAMENVSDVASEELNQPVKSDSLCSSPMKEKTETDMEKNVAEPSDPVGESQQFETNDNSNSTSEKMNFSNLNSELQDDDQEEGEIIEDTPHQKVEEKYSEHYTRILGDDFTEAAPKVNISELPRIPKLKREKAEPNVPEEPSLESKRSSVMERVDLGASDVSWKRLSKHTRERSYRDGRPKDEDIMFREREPKRPKRDKNILKDKEKSSKYQQAEPKKEQSSRHEKERSRERREHSHEKKSERPKGAHERSKLIEWSVAERREKDREKDKHGKSLHKEKYEKTSCSNTSKKDREKGRKEKWDEKKEKTSRNEHGKYSKVAKEKISRTDHSKEDTKNDSKYSKEDTRNDSKYSKEDTRNESKYSKEDTRNESKYNKESYELDRDRYERGYEKSKEKDHKRKHREHKPESCKKLKEDKKARSHSSEHLSEKHREREVRKIDDKLKILVEHKESRKSEKQSEHRDHKQEKKHREIFRHRHHVDLKKKDIAPCSYSDVTPIESKEIFAKGENIIINVNFNRASPREILSMTSANHERKLTVDSSAPENQKSTEDNRSSKSLYSLFDEDKNSDNFSTKRPTTPVKKAGDRNSEALPEEDDFWPETESGDAKSPCLSTGSAEENCSDFDNDAPSASESYCVEGNEMGTDNDNSNMADDQPFSEKENVKIEPILGDEGKITDNVSVEKKEDTFVNTVVRRPQPPSPPSPEENDCYDPCDPTRSPPSLPVSPLTPGTDKPKPPPSPELPPLPPEPEPVALCDEGKITAPETLTVSSVSSPRTQPSTDLPTMTVETPKMTMPNVLMPPPSFLLQSSPRTSAQRQMMGNKAMNWTVPNHPSPMLFSSNHAQPIIRGSFLPSHIPTMNLPSANVTASIITQSNSISVMSQIPHLPLNTHAVIPANSLLQNAALNHVNLSHMQMPHLNHPPPNMAGNLPHQVPSMQNPNIANSISNQSRMMTNPNQLSASALSLQNQQASLAAILQSQNIARLISAQNQMLSSGLAMSQKVMEKHVKSPLAMEQSGVIDMDVDSPYSPGDSPSPGSNGAYSPPTGSPLQDEPPIEKDIFDSLLPPDVSTEVQNKTSSRSSSSKSRQSFTAATEPSNKKMKLADAHTESSSRPRHHSIRLTVEKERPHVEQKSAEKRETASKFDDSQLKILDELPSSAVEMQFLKKLNRQERVVEEVKLALKPYYKTRDVTKEEYKDILRKAVPKVYHNKTGEINPVRIKTLIESYVKKVQVVRKKAAKKKRKASKFT